MTAISDMMCSRARDVLARNGVRGVGLWVDWCTDNLVMAQCGDTGIVHVVIPRQALDAYAADDACLVKFDAEIMRASRDLMSDAHVGTDKTRQWRTNHTLHGMI